MKKLYTFLVIMLSLATFGQNVTTFAGSAGVVGSANGTGSAAGFYAPSGVAVDASGNVYVADSNNYTIRKITVAGEVSTLAGLVGVAGSADGIGSEARFMGTYGVAVDASGNVYVADNHTIRKITAAGMVSTFAGAAGVSGSTDGIGSAARFKSPTEVAVDAFGNVYVADYGNHTIRKITAAGVVSTLAGAAGITGSADGIGTLARFKMPIGVAVDVSGNVYVADTDNHTIRKITAAGIVSTFAGMAGVSGNTDGTGSAARFYATTRVAVDVSGNVYVSDVGYHTIRKITAAGVVSSFAGFPAVIGSSDGTGYAAHFNLPKGVAVDASGNVYVADTGNNTIRKITGVLGKANFEIVSTLKIYPNPATNKVTLERNDLQKSTLEVIDITGKEVMKQSLNSSSNTVNMEKLPSGTYLFKVFSDEGVSSHKIIKK